MCFFIFLFLDILIFVLILLLIGIVGIEIIFIGSGFIFNIQEVNVIIGRIICYVVSFNEIIIKCIVGQLIGGLYDVVVKIGNKGFVNFLNGLISFIY